MAPDNQSLPPPKNPDDFETLCLKRARELSETNKHRGKFSVTVWSWREIWLEICRHPGLLQRLGPTFWPLLWEAFGNGDTLNDLASRHKWSGRFQLPPRIKQAQIQVDGCRGRTIRDVGPARVLPVGRRARPGCPAATRRTVGGAGWRAGSGPARATGCGCGGGAITCGQHGKHHDEDNRKFGDRGRVRPERPGGGGADGLGKHPQGKMLAAFLTQNTNANTLAQGLSNARSLDSLTGSSSTSPSRAGLANW